jgi:hypothetical protein
MLTHDAVVRRPFSLSSSFSLERQNPIHHGKEVPPVASRLYFTTRQLYTQVALLLRSLGIATVGSPTTAALIALYVTGLILLDVRQTQTRVTRFLPGRCHDALNRLLRVMPLSTRSRMALLIAWVQRHGGDGYLCLDDVVVVKAFAKKLPWAAWTYSFVKKRKVYGLHIVVLLWCSHDGTGASRCLSASGVPRAPVPRRPIAPSCNWPKRCSRRCWLLVSPSPT